MGRCPRGSGRPNGIIVTVKEKFVSEVLEAAAGRFTRGELMSRHTTLRVGGPADLLAEPADLTALRSLLQWADRNGVKTHFLGAGSNILAADAGVEGAVVRLSSPSFRRMERRGEELVCGAGVRIGDLIRFCGKEGIGGLEFLSSIPGTVGGAVAMNAGAWGEEVGGVLRSVDVVGRDGSLSCLAREKLSFGYRSLSLPSGTCVASATFAIRRRPPGDVREVAERHAAERRKRYPDGPSAGSIFKNPEGDYAGRLIEAAGLKGRSCGGARISERHANFIVNTGGATSADVFGLMDVARDAVENMFAVRLENEIHILGGVRR